MYILNIPSSIKRWQQKNSKTLSLKTIIDELDLLKENSYYSMKLRKKKDFLSLATKLIKKILDASNSKEHYKWILKNKGKKLLELKLKKTQTLLT